MAPRHPRGYTWGMQVGTGSGTEGTFFGSMVNVPREHGFEPLEVEGEVPAGLRGTYVRNGPGLLSRFGHRYEAWFDGDGMLSAARFGEDGVTGAARVLQTPGLLEERRRGRPYFGGYGTKAPGIWNPLRVLRLLRGTAKNPANTNVLWWHDRLFALCEIGRPFEARLADLGSVGETDLGGIVSRGFSAHPHRVAATDTTYNIGLQLGPRSFLDVFALPRDGEAERIASLPLGFPTLIHDFAATEKHLVVFVAPLRLSLLRSVLEVGPFVENLLWEPGRGTEVIVIPLDAPSSPKRFAVDAFWAWHVGNAFEAGDEIVVDLVRYPDFPSSSARLDDVSRGHLPLRGAEGHLERLRISPKRQTVERTPLRESSGEFPRVAPATDAREHRHVYYTEHSEPDHAREGLGDCLARVDVETGDADLYRFEDGHVPSEGVFAPRPGAEDDRDGWLLTLVYDPNAHRSYWAVFDAGHLADGPICKAHLDHHIPLTFHGKWLP